MPKTLAKTEPQLFEMAPQKMAVVRTVGDPNNLQEGVFKALYGAAYTLKFALKKQGVEYKVGALRGRWPDAHLVPKDQWQAIWGLPIPEETTAVAQKEPAYPVTIETWEYGTVAQILHLGPYSTEGPTIERLHAFITESGYEIAGDHEEEYLTRPDVKNQKTLIRYPVRKK